jgi:hypothetical protein
MFTRARLTIAVGAAVAAVVATMAGTADAAATKTLAYYTMNERAGTTVLGDASGHRINGTIGSHVLLSGTAHTFPYIKGGKGGTVDPQHLDRVNSSLLNPGTRDFSITLRLKFTLPVGNVLQKGQSGVAGGMFKIQLDDGGGRIGCVFVSPTGNGGVFSNRTINDGNWHVVTCTRTTGQVSVTVDGVLAGVIKHSTGNIANTWPLSIGGKTSCNQQTVFCDYFVGSIDYVRFMTS